MEGRRPAHRRSSTATGCKTGDRASAELIFSNGSLYTVGPNALLEIYSSVNPHDEPEDERRADARRLRRGRDDADDTSTVRTPGTQVVVESESTDAGRRRSGQRDAVVATRGAASVAPEKGGAAVRLAAGEKISATPAGRDLAGQEAGHAAGAALAGRQPGLPALAGADGRDDLETQRDGATGYVLQVSRSRLFSTQEINTRTHEDARRGAGDRRKGRSTGAWRRSGRTATSDRSPPFRRFRVSGGGTQARPQDRTPPMLTHEAAVPRRRAVLHDRRHDRAGSDGLHQRRGSGRRIERRIPEAGRASTRSAGTRSSSKPSIRQAIKR